MRRWLNRGRHAGLNSWRWLWTVGLVWLASTATCWAQTYGEEEPEEKAYAPCYIIIMMCVALGLMMICRTGKRSADVRRSA
jgi:hypothetical protein